MPRGPRKYTQEILTEAVAHSVSYADVMRYLGLRPAGGTHTHISRTIKSLGIDTSHFRKLPTNPRRRRLAASDILVRLTEGSLRTKPNLLTRALLEIGREYVCAGCGNDGTWCGERLGLDVDHIDGDFYNNLAWNLRFLCPNCHRQTDNFAGRSRNKYTGKPCASQEAQSVASEGEDDSAP
jgi:hypothetical protein